MAKLTANGVTLAYDDVGGGDPPFVFIHGLACNRSFWALQVENLGRDFRCVNVDLRGCGDSPAVPPFDMSTAADDVAALITALGLDRPIVVGHSLGGLVCLLLNDRHPELVRGIVLADAPLNHARAGFDDMVEAITDEGSMGALAMTIESFFVEETASDIQDQVRMTMLTCPPDVAAGMLSNSGVFTTGLDDLIKKADRKPFMTIWGGRPLGDPDHLRDITMFVRQEPMVGSGHFFQLEQPAITNALLRAFVDDVRWDPRIT
ncbi:MAG TPA: alpha/beta hydrolase [Tepidiformaceae bacterium]|jgi:pimeloyl-ACP methyl ester carboxylesterase